MKKLPVPILILALIISSTVFSQSKKSSDEILKEVTEKTKSYESIRIDFTYNMDNPEAKIHESEAGSLLVSGDKYRLNIAGQIIISDGETMWTYIQEVNEVQINTVEEDQELLTPSKLLTSYSEQYKSKLIGEESRDGKTYQVIELKPIENKTYSLVTLTVDKELQRFVRIAVQDNNGNTFTYIVKDFNPEIPVSENDFTFSDEEFPGAEVIDMR
jgi:outer membrane lipoprotein-sorting protein